MDKKTQVEIVTDVCDVIAKEIIEQIKAGKIPEDWEGKELRLLIERSAIHEAKIAHRHMGRAEMKLFENIVLVENL